MGCGASQEESDSSKKSREVKPVQEAPEDASGRYATVAGILCLHYSSNGAYLFAGGDDGMLHCVDGSTLAPNWRVKAHRGAITAVLSTDPRSELGACAVSTSKDGNVGVWNAADGTQLYKLAGHVLAINCLAIFKGDLTFFTGSSDKEVIAWDRRSKQQLRKYQGHRSTVWAVAVSADGEKLYSGSDDRTIKIWTVSNAHCDATLEGSKAPIYSILLSQCGNHLFTSARDRAVSRWNLASNKLEAQVRTGEDAIGGIAISVDGRTVYIVGSSISIWQWEAKPTELEPFKFMANSGIDGLFTCAATSPDNMKLAVGRDTSGFRIMDTSDFSLPVKLDFHQGTVAGLAVQGELIASCSEDTKITVWKLASGQLVRKFEGHTSRVWGITFNEDGSRVITASEDSTLRVWSISSGKCEQVLKGHTDSVWCVGLVPGCTKSTIVSGADDASLIVWQLDAAGAKYAKKEVLQGHSSPVVSVTATNELSPECIGSSPQAIASGSFDCTICLWSLKDNSHIVLRGHTEVVWALCFLGKQNLLVSGSEDKSIRIWDLLNKSCRRQFGAPAAVASLTRCLDPEIPDHSPVVVAGCSDGSMWKCDTVDISDDAKLKPFRPKSLHSDSVCSLVSTPEATISGSVDMSIRYWSHQPDGVNMSLRPLLEYSCKDNSGGQVSSPVGSPAGSPQPKRVLKRKNTGTNVAALRQQRSQSNVGQGQEDGAAEEATE